MGVARRSILAGLVALAALVGPAVWSASALAAPEAPITRQAGSVTATSAVLNGELNPNASATAGYEFLYNAGGSCEGGKATTPGAEATGKGIAVSTPVSELEGDTEYTFCAVATFTPAGEPTETTVGGPTTFITPAIAPTLEDQKSSFVAPSATNMEALVNPEDQPTSCVLEYGKSIAYEQSVSCGTLEAPHAEEGLRAEEFGTRVAGLEPASTYHYRFVVANATGRTVGADQQVHTLSANAPLIESESSPVLTPFGASLATQVNPEFQDTSCQIEYGTEASLANGTTISCEPGELGDGESAGVPVSLPQLAGVTLTGLKPNQKYYYRVIAINPTGKSEGKIEELTTPSGRALIESESVPVLTPFEATLEAKVNAEYQETTYSFQYATEATGEKLEGTIVTVKGAGPLGAVGGGQAVSVSTGRALAPGKKYYYRAIAVNVSGTTEGKVEELTTPPAEGPLIESENDPVVTPFEATLEAAVNAEYQETTYSFQYATEATGEELEGTIVTVKGKSPLGAVGGAQTASVSTGEALEPGKKYYYRAIAVNATGTTEGKVQELTTLPVERPLIESESVPVLTPFEATLEATVNPEYQETTYSFQYATEATGEELEGTIVTVKGAGPLEGGGGQAASVSTGRVLEGGRKYYYRVIAVNATGTSEGKVQELTTLPETPTVNSESASGVTALHAVLEAQVNPNDQATTVTFEYSSEEAAVREGRATKVAGGNIAAGPSPQPVSADLGEALTPGTIYYYRTVAKNATGTSTALGVVARFRTPVAAVLTATATNVTTKAATLSGTVNPEGVETTYHFVYIEQAVYEAAVAQGGAPREIDPALSPYRSAESTPEVSIGSDRSVLATQQVPIGELTPNTTYHYALVATNTQGTTVLHSGGTFTTLATPPALGEPAVSGITEIGASIAGLVDAQGLPTRYELLVGTEQGVLHYEASGSTSAQGAEAVTFAISSLTPGTLYYYRVSATNSSGTTETAEATFATAPKVVPVKVIEVFPPLELPSDVFPAAAPETNVPITTTPPKHANAKKLHKALKECRKKHPKYRRTACEKQAHKRYG